MNSVHIVYLQSSHEQENTACGKTYLGVSNIDGTRGYNSGNFSGTSVSAKRTVWTH